MQAKNREIALLQQQLGEKVSHELLTLCPLTMNISDYGKLYIYIYLIRTSSNCACVRNTRFFLYESIMKYFLLFSEGVRSCVHPTRSLCVEERGGRDRPVYLRQSWACIYYRPLLES